MDQSLLLKQRYQIQKTLRQGGLATTYLALDRQTNQPCVVKLLALSQVDDWQTVELFEREARILTHLDHPQIPKFIDFFTLTTEQDSHMCLVQEYVEGKNLAQLVQEGKHFTEKEIIAMALDISRVLEYLHGFSPPIIHRDIKPSNIILTSDKKVHLIDFGTVRDKMLHDKMRYGGGSTIVGIYGYMPLEQFEGRAVPASDIYSLGATLIYLLSHKEPGQVEKEEMRLDFRPHVHISRDFSRVLERMIEPDWGKRYQTASQLKEALERLLTGGPSVEWIRLITRWAAPVMTVIILFVGLGFYIISSRNQPVTPVLQQTYQEVDKTESLPLLEKPKTSPQEATEKAGILIGRLLFDGRPITEFTQERPSFWFRNEDTGKEQKAEVIYNNSHFQIRGLPTGHFGLSIYLNANKGNLAGYPGDFYVWKTFDVVERANPELVVDLQRVIHLTSPQDNGTVMKLWGAPCMEQIAFTSPVRFAWESLGDRVYYDYDISRMECSNTSKGTEAGGTITDTQIIAELPPSKENEFYMFHLSARKEGRRIGVLTTHGSNGIAWDYRFRVIESSRTQIPVKLESEPVVARDGKIIIDLYRDFTFVPQGWPLGLSVGQTSAGGLDYKPYETLQREPKYHSPEVLYGYLSLGNGEDPQITFVIDELERPTWVLYVDKNNNEDLTDDGPPHRNEGTLKLAANVSLDIDIVTSAGQKTKQPYKLWFWVNESNGEKWPRFYATCHYTGQISIDGQLYKAVAFEKFNHSGLYRESGLWIDLNYDNKLNEETEHFEVGEIIRVDQKQYQVELDYP